MIVIRPASLTDVPQLVELASLAGAGLTTLPKDPDFLEKKIRRSQHAFDKFPDRPGGESFLLVMEDLDKRRVVGACGMVTKVGGFEPFYSYKIEKTLFESDVINVRKEVPILRLHEEHDGPAEIGSLFLHPEYRGDGNGRLLQLVRFLFMAEHPEAFENTVVSEIRGVSDASGNSPFWNAIGAHFFDIDFQRADHLSIVNKKFIADLFPDHPIYIPLLPKSAQDVIGQPHEQSRPAVKNLEAEGMRFANMVDIFDAGPVLIGKCSDIRTIRDSRRVPVAQISADEIESPFYMISNTSTNFRAVKGTLREDVAGVTISRDCAKALNVRVADPVRYVLLKPAEKK